MALELYQLISAFMTHVRVVRSICMKGARDTAAADDVRVSVIVAVPEAPPDGENEIVDMGSDRKLVVVLRYVPLTN